MVSATQQTFRIRRRKARKAGKDRKREMRAGSTPAFPIHPETASAKPAAAKK